MNCLQVVLGGLALALASGAAAQSTKPVIQTPSAVRQAGKAQTFAPALVNSSKSLFQQNCAFCHGRDAGGGETGPDLTSSKLVAEDLNGDKIGAVIRNGRVERGMPRFALSDQEIAGLVAFVHMRKTEAESQVGGRRGVDPQDLQSGNADAGKIYFNGGGGCAGCHSPTGDLAGVAGRYVGLKLEQRLLYPRGAQAEATIRTPDGKTYSGKLMYHDEFTLGLRDSAGWYRSWPVSQVKVAVHDPASAHAELLGKYTDADIHNLMAYLQTLR